jgi:hypothetical protein
MVKGLETTLMRKCEYFVRMDSNSHFPISQNKSPKKRPLGICKTRERVAQSELSVLSKCEYFVKSEAICGNILTYRGLWRIASPYNTALSNPPRIHEWNLKSQISNPKSNHK